MDSAQEKLKKSQQEDIENQHDIHGQTIDEYSKLKILGWTDLTEINVSKIKKVPGVYELAQCGDGIPICTYVDHSGNLFERILNHFHGLSFTTKGKRRVSNLLEIKKETEELGFTLAFRYSMYGSKEIAESNEYSLLMSYDYA
eukprot:gene12456-6207_t